MRHQRTGLSLGLFVPTLSRDFDRVQASVWIRALQMVPYYRVRGVSVHINNPLRRYDVAIVFRIPSRGFYGLCKWLKRTCGAVYFDTVVNYFVPHAKTTAEHLHYQKKIADICAGVICSTEPIAQEALRFNSRVHVMHDPLDTRHFAGVKEEINYDRPQWGWSGISSKAEALLAYKEKLQDPILMITDEGIRHHRFEMAHHFRRWSYGTFPASILECDLAFLPRKYEGDPYNQGHSAFKALVFAASGVPVVASRLPSYARLAGFYAGIVFLEDHDDDPWACAEALRGCRASAVESVPREYGCEHQAEQLLSFVGEAK